MCLKSSSFISTNKIKKLCYYLHYVSVLLIIPISRLQPTQQAQLSNNVTAILQPISVELLSSLLAVVHRVFFFIIDTLNFELSHSIESSLRSKEDLNRKLDFSVILLIQTSSDGTLMTFQPRNGQTCSFLLTADILALFPLFYSQYMQITIVSLG